MACEHEDELLNRRGPGKGPFSAAAVLLPALGLALLAILCESTGFDLRASDAWYALEPPGWPLKHSWWAEGLIHEAGRTAVALSGVSALLAWGLSFRVSRLRSWRRAALYLVLAIGLSTGGVALLKVLTGRPCPWDLDRYGGKSPYVHLLELRPPEVPRGECFPAAHAAAGYSLTALYFALRERSRRRSLAGLLLGLGLGTLFGFGQLVRGAHFVSHSLWSAALCWLTAAELYRGLFGSRLGPPGRAGGEVEASRSGDLSVMA